MDKPTLATIAFHIRKELSRGGIHTYHQCECDRGSCRSVQCRLCWGEELVERVGERHGAEIYEDIVHGSVLYYRVNANIERLQKKEDRNA